MPNYIFKKIAKFLKGRKEVKEIITKSNFRRGSYYCYNIELSRIERYQPNRIALNNLTGETLHVWKNNNPNLILLENLCNTENEFSPIILIPEMNNILNNRGLDFIFAKFEYGLTNRCPLTITISAREKEVDIKTIWKSPIPRDIMEYYKSYIISKVQRLRNYYLDKYKIDKRSCFYTMDRNIRQHGNIISCNRYINRI
jgi:hypothetical protein